MFYRVHEKTPLIQTQVYDGNVHSIVYRPDIDGLRCLAVLPVIVYHAYPTIIPGGFTGVDIFFVISGYLISGILFKDLMNKNFSYRGFYSRRIRRIFPALIIVLSFCIPLGCSWYLATPLKNMAETLWAGAMFGANLQVLSLKQGYFDANVKEDPLLHLWSLGVEEQFYIFWPLFAAFIVKLSYRKAIIAQVTVMVVSYCLNVGMLGFHGNNNWSFYFPLCRFWQMSIGGLLAYAQLPTVQAEPALNRAAVSFIGLQLVVVGFYCLTETNAYPGTWSLLPTLGAACLIFAGPDAPFNHYLLSNPVMVFIGKISYGLYLWHWPFLVFFKARYPNDEHRPWLSLPYMLLIYSFLLSILMLYLVENQLRRRKAKWVVPLLTICMIFMVGAGITLQTYPSYFSTLTRETPTPVSENNPPPINPLEEPNTSRPPCLQKPTLAKLLAANDDWNPNPGYINLRYDSPFGYFDYGFELNPGSFDNLVIVLGDSHAEMLRPRFKLLYDQAMEKGESFPTMVFFARGGHPPLQCIDDHAQHVLTVLKMKPKVVLYSTDWPQFIRPTGEIGHGDNPPCCNAGYQDDCSYQSWVDAKTILDLFSDEVQMFTAMGIKVFAATMNPEGKPFNYRNMLQGTEIVATEPVLLSDYRHQHERLVTMIEKAIRDGNGTVIDYAENQCFENVCQVVSMIEGEPIMKDNDHFRPYYSKYYLSRHFLFCFEMAPRLEIISCDTSIQESTPLNQSSLAKNSTIHAISYRPDIDGLRALAVIPVLLFHAYPKKFPGCFTGVDIFFVISGYLISSILFKEFQKDVFTYSDFYARRVRRIFPGLLLIMTFTIVLGCIIYTAKPLKSMAETLCAGALFGANLQILSRDIGFLEGSTNPLLHLWSLGVEEQFYIFWPIFTALIIKLSYRKAIIAQVVVMVLCFCLNIALLGYQGNYNWSFYFPLCRFWQMSIGGLLAYIHRPPGTILTPASSPPSSSVSNVTSIAGLCMILFAFTAIDENSVFPGYWSLVPTIGAGCLIYAGMDALFNNYVLSLSPVVFIGKISYALYLWHWPMLVYAKAYYPNDNTRPFFMLPFMILFYAFICSVLTLYIVENRLRRRKSKWVVPMLVLGMIIVLLSGAILYTSPTSMTFTTTPRYLRNNYN
ncbi:acyltransferase 3 [Thraustotheca clavata]|uniref:Acyltransferase 3 n=1 Tax=Thraustotheca clavata TaxID=74557 RepID=A0A1V9ZZD8_9STRA|nr:acyltransferase 3 [Thraustotheca clavata]